MLIVVSPAKTLDYESELPALKATQPRLLDDSEVLIAVSYTHLTLPTILLV